MQRPSVLEVLALALAALCLAIACGRDTTAPPDTGPRPIAKVSPGGEHTCSLTPAGEAYCWGRNTSGQVGDGTTTDRLTPVAVATPAGLIFTSLGAGWDHTCGLTPAGTAYCWGSNVSGKIGDGTETNRLTPVPVAIPEGVTFASVATGVFHACGLTTAEVVYCWGRNTHGKLGDGTTTDRPQPVAVAMPAGVTFTSVGAGRDHSCGLTAAGVAYCWGRNLQGQLGDGTQTSRHQPGGPVAMPAGVSFASLAIGGYHTCGLTSAGVAYCWGYNYEGQVGDGTATTDVLAPVAVAVPAGLTFTGLAAGLFYTCGLSPTQGAYCWGSNSSGQLGDGTTTNRSTPVAVAMPAGVTFASLGTGIDHTCALTPTVDAYCWGENFYGRLGDGTSTDRLTPVKVVQP